MKKIYFLIVFLIGFTVNGQIINFLDVNFKKALLETNKSGGLALGINENQINIDANGNGQIEVSEAKAIYYLDIGNLNSNNITELSGIEHFTNLVELSVSYNNIEYLNVSSLTNLKSLSCIKNPLKTVNLNGLSKLEYLYAGWTEITDVSFVNQLPSIIHVAFNDNKINNVNFNGLLNLKSVIFDHNIINSFKISNCPNIEELLVQNNMIPNLEVNDLTKLTVIKCFNNLLTELDVSNLKDLNELTFSSNPPLDRVFMKNGKNEYNVDLFDLPNLKYICADESQIEMIQNEINYKKL